MIWAMLPAYTTETGSWKVWCPYCGCLHEHAAEPGYRVPPCGYARAPGTTPPRGYYLVPTGQPLPSDINGHPPRWEFRPCPKWGEPITGHWEAYGFMTEWTYRTHKTECERAEIMAHFERAWDCFTAYSERQDKLRAMNIDPDVFTECLRDVLTFDE